MPTRKKRPAMASASTIAQLEAGVQQRWFALTQADDAGADAEQLETLFISYMADLAALIAARASASTPLPPPQRAPRPPTRATAPRPHRQPDATTYHIPATYGWRP